MVRKKKHTTAEQRKHEKITAQPRIDIVVRDDIGLEK